MDENENIDFEEPTALVVQFETPSLKEQAIGAVIGVGVTLAATAIASLVVTGAVAGYEKWTSHRTKRKAQKENLWITDSTENDSE